MNQKERKRIQMALDSISERSFKDMGEDFLAFCGAIGALEFALSGGEGDLTFDVNGQVSELVSSDDIDEMLENQ
jgi:hypothetical protein